MLIARENKTAGVQIQIICLLKAKNIFAPLLGVLFRVSLRCACVAVKFAETPPLRHGEHRGSRNQNEQYRFGFAVRCAAMALPRRNESISLRAVPLVRSLTSAWSAVPALGCFGFERAKPGPRA
jgi:hypothetical protein